MGIVNITPDSFSRDGCLAHSKKGTGKAVKLAFKQIRDGADIIDIGGESSRPWSSRITAKEEIRRIIPTITTLAKEIKTPISVDTYKPLVAKHALDAGAVIVNNIMGVNPDKKLLKMVKDYKAAIVLMHIKGTPKTMQKSVKYEHLITEIIEDLKKSIEICLETGIDSDRIIIDPGIGFGKTVKHNLEIINQLKKFKALKKPILLGTSRKSFIGKVLDKEVPNRLTGTIASVVTGIMNGAHIIRAHDVQETKEASKLTDAIINEKVTS